jgi:glutamate N-acetyltransferase/amino-acid N-acetyltransferase
VTPTTPPEPPAIAPGFRAGAAACGLKSGDALDVALLAADRPCVAAGVFTTNRVKAAPVLLDLEVLRRGAGAVRAVVANSGGANACTGPLGMENALRMAALAAQAVGCDAHQVLVLSTGVIGRQLDMAKLSPGIAAAARDLSERDAVAGGARAARAILTTDTRPKTARAEAGGITVAGFAKGAGMIHPQLATMLAVLTTDAIATPEALADTLRAAVERSFNRVSVDGDMSTNDTVLLLASGASGRTLDGPAATALEEVCVSLARQIARDGEGATRLVEVHVRGAASEREAHQVADAIARSSLVKTAIHGGDPNWGRVLAAAGASGVALAPERTALAFGSGPGTVRLVSAGLPLEFDAAAASSLLRRDPVEVHLDLGLGDAAATVWTCDLSAEYVAINAHYTT